MSSYLNAFHSEISVNSNFLLCMIEEYDISITSYRTSMYPLVSYLFRPQYFISHHYLANKIYCPAENRQQNLLSCLDSEHFNFSHLTQTHLLYSRNSVPLEVLIPRTRKHASEWRGRAQTTKPARIEIFNNWVLSDHLSELIVIIHQSNGLDLQLRVTNQVSEHEVFFTETSNGRGVWR